MPTAPSILASIPLPPLAASMALATVVASRPLVDVSMALATVARDEASVVDGGLEVTIEAGLVLGSKLVPGLEDIGSLAVGSRVVDVASVGLDTFPAVGTETFKDVLTPVVALAVAVVPILTATLAPTESKEVAGVVAPGSSGSLGSFPAVGTVLFKDASTPNSRPLAVSILLATVGLAVGGVSARTVGSEGAALPGVSTLKDWRLEASAVAGETIGDLPATADPLFVEVVAVKIPAIWSLLPGAASFGPSLALARDALVATMRELEPLALALDRRVTGMVAMSINSELVGRQ